MAQRRRPVVAHACLPPVATLQALDVGAGPADELPDAADELPDVGAAASRGGGKRVKLGPVPADARGRLGCAKCVRNVNGCSKCRVRLGLQPPAEGTHALWAWALEKLCQARLSHTAVRVHDA